MAAHAHAEDVGGWFFKAEEDFGKLVTILKSRGSDYMTASEIEALVRKHLQGIGRDLIEGKMNEIGRCEVSAPVIGRDGVERNQRELLGRNIETSFGGVEYSRRGYGAIGVESLFPADGHLNLPPEKYTLEVRRLLGEDVTLNGYDDVLGGLKDRCGAEVPKRQGIELVGRAAVDFESFYEKRSMAGERAELSEGVESGSLLVLTTDAKGVVMRSEGLCEQTQKAAVQEKHKLDKRMSRGEKRNRKRMTQVASVYTVDLDCVSHTDSLSFKSKSFTSCGFLRQ